MRMTYAEALDALRMLTSASCYLFMERSLEGRDTGGITIVDYAGFQAINKACSELIEDYRIPLFKVSAIIREVDAFYRAYYNNKGTVNVSTNPAWGQPMQGAKGAN